MIWYSAKYEHVKRYWASPQNNGAIYNELIHKWHVYPQQNAINACFRYG